MQLPGTGKEHKEVYHFTFTGDIEDEYRGSYTDTVDDPLRQNNCIPLM